MTFLCPASLPIVSFLPCANLNLEPIASYNSFLQTHCCQSITEHCKFSPGLHRGESLSCHKKQLHPHLIFFFSGAPPSPCCSVGSFHSLYSTKLCIHMDTRTRKHIHTRYRLLILPPRHLLELEMSLLCGTAHQQPHPDAHGPVHQELRAANGL